ncbi:Co2+/Mg2+ efflux protein ApaG [soil metagenome]
MIERTTTHGVQIEVESRFVPENSDADHGQFLFAYEIRITNTTESRVQLLNRHWIITDGLGRIEEVKGPGVIGQQPWIAPGETFEYESFCPLTTPTGSMRGSYEMTSLSESSPTTFSAEIPQFFLVEPGSFH